MKYISIFKSKLAKKFSFYIVSIGIITALIISAVSVYFNYKSEICELRKELHQLEKSLKNSFALNLWEVNTPALKIMIDDLLRNKYIVYAKLIDDEGNVLIEKGKIPKDFYIKRELKFYYTINNKKYYVGKLIYYVSTKKIYEQNKNFIIRAIIAIFSFFLFLSFIIIIIYWKTTIKYLNIIKLYTQMLKQYGYKKGIINPLNLNRNKNDELDELANSINEMHKEIVKKYGEIEFKSFHDPLTGLANRRLIDVKFKEILKKCKQYNCYGSLFYIDLDNFKIINDAMGHSIGDKILIEIAKRLKKLCKDKYLVARISGDEFLILQTQVDKNQKDFAKDVVNFAKKILDEISKPIKINDNTFKITASIGISIFGPDSTPEIAIKQADNALYHAKRKGKGNIEIFQVKMQQTINKHLQIKQLLDKAIEKNLLFMTYQPKFNINQEIISAESLVRLKNEEGNIISPAEFIPILEESGAIIEIGEEIIKKVYTFIKNNINIIQNSTIKSIAINISPTQYNHPKFVDSIIKLTKEFDINPKLIIFEITEEVVASDIDKVIDTMNKLTQYGFNFSIDDFGTGYSSMKYLKNLPIKEIKIDKSFIDEITFDKKSKAIVKTIIDMAHNLNLDVVAEGVESKEQLEILERFNCDLYQGYYFSKPLKVEDFIKILKH